MCRRFFILLLISLPFLISVDGVKQFRLGRSKNGNVGVPGGDVQEPLPRARWFAQRLDHSAPTDLRTWKQRFFVNDSFYDPHNPGPVFLMVGGEGPADAKWMVKGTWIDFAQKFKALCIMLEHRYYGESHPTKDISIKNLQYLSSYQALADIANFINAMNGRLGLDRSKVKWVAFGGSYPGSLAAWLRVKYPHLVYASVSSSGPLLAKLDFQEYFEVVANALVEKTSSHACIDKVKAGHKQIEALLDTNPELLDKEFRTCEPLRRASAADVKSFYNSLADEFAELVQYNEDNRMAADPRYRNLTINTVCDMLTSETNESAAYISLGKFNSIVLDKNNQTCLDYSYDNMIKELRNISWSSGEGGRQWMYQTCTEFGFYQTSSGEPELFGDHFDVDFFVRQCRDVFGDKFNERFISGGIEWTNSEYGALGVAAERVVFVHGSVDPWHALGVTRSADPRAPALLVPGAAHCADMYPPRAADSPALRRARDAVRRLLAAWLPPAPPAPSAAPAAPA